MARTILSRLLAGFLITLTITSCTQKPAVKKKPPAKGKYLTDILVSRGEKFINSNVDSLIPAAGALALIAQNTGDKKALVYSELFRSQYFWLSGNHEKSMQVAVGCLTDAEKWNIRKVYPSIFGLISNLHKENSNFKLAFDAQQRGWEWALANKDTDSMISQLNLKAMLIHTYAEITPSFKNDSSINIQMAALKIAEANTRFEGLRIPFYDNISQYYLGENDYKKAIYYAQKGLTLALKYNRPRSLTYSYTWLGSAYFDEGDKRKGVKYFNKALKIAYDIKEPYREWEIREDMADCYESSGNYKKAFALSKKAHDMKDSMQVNVNEKQISELQIKYETAKKDKEILILDHAEMVKNRQILLVLGGSLMGITFSTILLLQYRVIRRSNKMIKISNEKKDKALADIAFIQAHELRRPVASIMGIINVVKAMDYEFDAECISNLEKAAAELDERIHSVLAHVETEADYTEYPLNTFFGFPWHI